MRSKEQNKRHFDNRILYLLPKPELALHNKYCAMFFTVSIYARLQTQKLSGHDGNHGFGKNIMRMNSKRLEYFPSNGNE